MAKKKATKKAVKKKAVKKKAATGKQSVDTKPMEMIAENLIAHFLQRHGIFVAKPQFDQEGGDLLAMTTEGGIRSCKIQCKGRSVLKRDSEVLIRATDVKDSLVVCLFVDDGSFDKLNLFAFFADDIQKWPKATGGKNYRLAIPKAFEDGLADYKVTEHTIQRIANEIMKVQAPTTVSYKYTGSGGVTVKGAGTAKKTKTAKK